ncbi:hypothetical protein CW311_01710 [Acinetobacter proteolyticus]|uniref:Uncharacterized protein n=1 Tax=Acinetobacter proteolyticus TaxID=1776741 RepID=A0A2N0WK60_9GAMM|nr:hypothetical protein CW311_01710 [Acinetobacter proteolyticus]
MFIMNLFNVTLGCQFNGCFLLNSNRYFVLLGQMVLTRSFVLLSCLLLILNCFLNKQVVVWVYFK